MKERVFETSREEEGGQRLLSSQKGGRVKSRYLPCEPSEKQIRELALETQGKRERGLLNDNARSESNMAQTVKRKSKPSTEMLEKETGLFDGN